jgi:hypothetical protein
LIQFAIVLDVPHMNFFLRQCGIDSNAVLSVPHILTHGSCAWGGLLLAFHNNVDLSSAFERREGVRGRKFEGRERGMNHSMIFQFKRPFSQTRDLRVPGL